MSWLDKALQGAQQGATMRAESEARTPEYNANIMSALLPQDLTDVGLMAMGLPGKLAKLGGLGLAGMGYSPDAEAGLLLGPAGALKAGLTQLYKALTKEQVAAKELGKAARLQQVTGQPKIWTGMDLKPRTYLPSTKFQLANDLKVGERRKFLDAVSGLQPEYVKAYPSIRDLLFYVDPKLKGASGQFGPGGLAGQISIRPDLLGTKEARKTVLHELTHAAPQGYSYLGDNFTSGGSRETAKQLILSYKKLIKDLESSKPGTLKHRNYQEQLNNHPLTGWGDGSDFYNLDKPLDEMQHAVYEAYPGEVDARMMEVVGDSRGFVNVENPFEFNRFEDPSIQLQVPYGIAD